MSTNNKRKRNTLSCMNKECRMIFFNASSLQNHYKNNFSCYMKNPYNCNTCKISFVTNRGLINHLSRNNCCRKKSILNKNVDYGHVASLQRFRIIDEQDDTIDKTCSAKYIIPTKDHEKTTVSINYEKNKKKIHRNIDAGNTKKLIETRNIFDDSISCSMCNADYIDHKKGYIRDECINTFVDDSSSNEEYQEEVESNTNDGIECTDIQKNMSRHNSNTIFQDHTLIMMDLFLMLKSSNASMKLFDKVISFMNTHKSQLQNTNVMSLLCQRRKFVEDIKNQLCAYDNDFFNPKKTYIQLSSKRKISITTFSLKNNLIKIVNNELLMKKEHLLINYEDPCNLKTCCEYYGDINTGQQYIDSWNHIQNNHFTKNNDNNVLPCPLIFFIDGLTIDKYGKLSLEAVLCCVGLFKRYIRNRESSWFLQGFVENNDCFDDDTKKYDSVTKMIDYHDMLRHIMNDLKNIYEGGGLYITLNISGSLKRNVYLVPFILFVVGDCKGNDYLCGRYGSHQLSIDCLTRDCTIKSEHASDTCIDRIGLKCRFLNKYDFINKSKEELKKRSFHDINNVFVDLPFGGSITNIWGGTPVELLHAVEMGLCDYIYDSYILIFTDSEQEIISKTVSSIVISNYRQSERSFPDISHFKNGLGFKNLKAKERFYRCVMIYIALNNSFCVDALIQWRRKHNKDDLFTTLFLKNYMMAIENTIILHEWLKKETYLKTEITTNNHKKEDSCALLAIKQYLYHYKTYIQRKGNNLDTPKFHQILHIPEFIRRFGCPNNFDGSIGEQKGKTLIKNNAKLTTKQKGKISYDVCKRMSEQTIIDEAAKTHYVNTGRFPSVYCNDIDILQNGDNNGKDKDGRIYTYGYKVKIGDEWDEKFEEKTGEFNNELQINVDIKWNDGQNYKKLDNDLIMNIVNRLFIQSNNMNISGKINYKKTSEILGITTFQWKNNIYRCDPCFFGKPWFDWVYIKWDRLDSKPIPAQLKVVLDLRNADIIFDNEVTEEYKQTMNTLSQDIWIVVSSCEENEDSVYKNLSDCYFDSKLHDREFRMKDGDDLWMVPMEYIYGPCFVIENKNYVSKYYESNDDNDTVYVMEPMYKWGNFFINNK